MKTMMAKVSSYVCESEALRERFDRMSHDGQVLVALACAKRLVRADILPRRASIIAQLNQGWLASRTRGWIAHELSPLWQIVYGQCLALACARLRGSALPQLLNAPVGLSA